MGRVEPMGSEETSENIPTLHRQYSRAFSQLSNISHEFKSKIKKQKANAARLVINQKYLQIYSFDCICQLMSIFQTYRLSTYAKLFGAMGLTWLFEVIAWLIAMNNGNVPDWFNFLVNSANILQVNLKHTFLYIQERCIFFYSGEKDQISTIQV